MAALYLAVSLFGGIWGWRLLYPIRLFVTFMHEFGHAFGALITGGSVDYIRIEPNSGGLTVTRGGNTPLILMGGYLGSALFGNILFYIGAAKPKWVKPTLGLVIAVMLLTGLIWYNSLFTTALLCVFSAGLFYLGFKTKYGRDMLMFLGLASLLYILQDSASGPSSDLAAFKNEMRFLPAIVWLGLWVGVALGLLAFNLKLLLKKKEKLKSKDKF